MLSSSSSSRFDCMPAHPPTPPKEISKAVDDAISFLDDSHEIERALSKSHIQRRGSLQPAVSSPAPSPESTGNSISKKVVFSPHTVYHHPPRQDLLHLSNSKSTKRSPSGSVSKPRKSILKATTAAPPLTPDDLESKLVFSPDVPGSFAKMLQSVLNQLASQTVSHRLDAYLSLNGALQTYGDLPDPEALRQKLGLLTQFLARDLAWKNSDGSLNTQIVFQALKLTNVLLFNDSVSTAFDADFRSFLVERSITVMESTDIPKQIMKAHIHLLAQPKLQYTAITASRADKILNALQTIEQRCSGNNVVATRLIIYQRLLDQAPTVMLTRIRDWLEQVFHCLLSSISDIRGRAIDTCMKGGLRLGTQPHATKALCDFLDTEIEEGQSYYQYFSTKMMEMITDKEIGPCVPRIWSALTLYFRNKRKPLEKWTNFKDWLVMIQRCMNSSNILVRYEATLAWNKLVYTVTFDGSPSSGMLKMLKAPVLTGIERRGPDQFSRQVRHHAIECYHNLLHYGLRPSLSSEELDTHWDALVDPILIPMVKASAKGCATACRILNGLLSGNNGVWNVNAALMTTPIKSADLPKIEPRWIRSHMAKMLKVLQPAVRSAVWLDCETTPTVYSAWAALMQTIADAGAQEVRMSNDLKQAIACLVGFIRQLWDTKSQPPEDHDIQRWRGNITALIDNMVTTIGPEHFVEDFLTTSDSNVIEVAPTPSTNRSRAHATPQSPMVILLRPFFVSDETGNGEDLGLKPAVSALLDRFVSSKASLLARMEVLSRSLFSVQNAGLEASERLHKASVWQIFAQSATSALQPYPRAEQQQQGSLGQCLRHTMEILSAGTATRMEESTWVTFTSLYDTMYKIASDSAGDGGIAIAVMEPASKSLLSAGDDLVSWSRIELVTRVLSSGVWPKTRQSIESARKALWGPGLAPHKSTLFDPFDHVYKLLVDCLTRSYLDLAGDAPETLSSITELFSAAVSFLERAPLSLLPTALRRTQQGFALWAQDEARKSATDNRVSEVITTTWAAILRLMKSILSSDSSLLTTLEALFVAGFSSPHRQIVNDTIIFWNAKFGTQESLEYPSKLECVLRARMLDASVDLPNFPDSNPEHVPASLPDFFTTESQAPVDLHAKRPHHLQPYHSEYFTAQKSPAASKQSTIPSSKDRRSKASASSTPKVRLRHDDSQIQFAPIDSSPIRFIDDSQHLTEHQKEVTARQNQAAQMFPEMSSSPMAQSTALPRALPKRLNFSSEARSENEEEQGPGTPTAEPETAGIMSDDLPSSPTPSSTKDASQAAFDLDDDQVTEDELDEPPSSPPRTENGDGATADAAPAEQDPPVGPGDTTVEMTDFELPSPSNIDQEAIEDAPVLGEVEETGDLAEDRSGPVDLPSDTILPNEQLQWEEEAAEIERQTPKDKASKSLELQEANEEQENAHPQTAAAESSAHDVTRVEDSFIGHAQDGVAEEEDAASSQGSRRSTRKRKRTSSVTYTTKKQKSASPFKRFISKIWSNSQQDDDDDMGDEIVVASSQRSQSPVSPVVQADMTSQAEAAEPSSQPFREQTSDTIVIKQEIMAPPKRRPGRPRKSETPTPSLGQSQDETQTRSLKRKASVLSNARAADTETSTSSVKDTPAPSKSRRGRKGQPVSQASEASSSSQLEGSQTGGTTRRTVTSVMVPRQSVGPDAEDKAEVAATADETAGPRDNDTIAVSTPEKPTTVSNSVSGGAEAVDSRPKLTPRSILGRLRDALSDFVGMKVSTSEAREFDDVLFEFRREVHEADRRGRTEE